MRSLLSLSKVINRKSLIVSALAVLSTWLCLRLDIIADFPETLIATAIVFPLVFSISTAYNRREKALEDYGSIKAHGRALYLAARDWLGDGDPELVKNFSDTLTEILSACRHMFMRPLAELPVNEQRVYAAFSKLSLCIRQLRDDGLSSTECSRCNQYLSKMVISFENTRHIFEYRTPRTLRAFSEFFILLLPILYGPYFAAQAQNFSKDLFYIMPVLFSLILVGLSNIQDHLENPFDEVGEDDIRIEEKEIVALMQ